MNPGVEQPIEERQTLEAFFAGREEPSTPESSFTPARVAEIIRHDRDASE